MAALCEILGSKYNIFRNINGLINFKKCHQVTRCFSSTTGPLDDNQPVVVMSGKGRTIVCWHPEQKFPYEHSKPLPNLKQELIEEDSVLNIQHRLDNLKRFKQGGPTDKELEDMTYTYKTQWFPMARKNKRPTFPEPKSREGL